MNLPTLARVEPELVIRCSKASKLNLLVRELGLYVGESVLAFSHGCVLIELGTGSGQYALHKGKGLEAHEEGEVKQTIDFIIFLSKDQSTANAAVSVPTRSNRHCLIGDVANGMPPPRGVQQNIWRAGLQGNEWKRFRKFQFTPWISNNNYSPPDRTVAL